MAVVLAGLVWTEVMMGPTVTMTIVDGNDRGPMAPGIGPKGLGCALGSTCPRAPVSARPAPPSPPSHGVSTSVPVSVCGSMASALTRRAVGPASGTPSTTTSTAGGPELARVMPQRRRLGHGIGPCLVRWQEGPTSAPGYLCPKL